MKGQTPESPLDLLVVGGGPCGTATAWRAHELGLSVLVIDRECVLSIVKEWAEHQPKPKDVDADYGDRTDLQFPPGGALIGQLPYEDQTPADQLYAKWIKVYQDNQIPYKDGFELYACTRLPNGVLAAECMELQTQARSKVYAKNLVLALGRGSPAKVRLMGDGLGIRYKLGNSADFVGAPACVVGGGMSAAEAVVAIALAKAAAKDSSDVFWCSRGRGMPKVAQGKALAAKFYEAWTAGSIRYLPSSEPLAVFKDDKGKELVAVRTRRVEQPSQPPELVCYEFEKKQVLAFIGAERPVDLLSSIGIAEFELADAPGKKRLAVSGLLESQVPGVFMGGGLLHPAYLEASDFRPQALQSTLKDNPTSFKQGMIEGVAMAETVFQRMKRGASDEAIRDQLRKQSSQAPVAASKPAPAPAKVEAPAAPEMQLGAGFVHIPPGDNPQKTDHFFPLGDSIVGRTAGRVVISSDSLLAEQHAAFRVEDDECYVTNAPWGGECYVKVNSERTLPPGAIIVAGRQRLRVDLVGGQVSLARLDAKGQVARTLPLSRDERSIRRDDLDPRDFALSREHLLAADAGGMARIRDSSRNGTFVELQGSLRLQLEDEVLMGEQRFKFVGLRSELMQGGGTRVPLTPTPTQAFARTAAPAAPAAAPAPAPAAPAAPRAPAAAPAAAAPAPAAAAPVAAPSGAPSITVAGGAALPAGDDGPMLSYLADAELAANDPESIGGKTQTQWDCWDRDRPNETGGTCGKCCVVVTAGMGSLSDYARGEKNTMAKKSKKYFGAKFDEGKCRLACQARVKGAVTIQQLGKAEG
jgi:thioredoxin reductase